MDLGQLFLTGCIAGEKETKPEAIVVITISFWLVNQKNIVDSSSVSDSVFVMERESVRLRIQQKNLWVLEDNAADVEYANVLTWNMKI